MTTLVQQAIHKDLPFLIQMCIMATFPAAHLPPLTYNQALRHPAISPWFRSWKQNKGDLALLALSETTRCPIGAAWYRLFPNTQQIPGFLQEHIPVLALAVKPECRSQGVGSSLLDALTQQAWQQSYTGLSLAVGSTNKPAIRLYERFGFTRKKMLSKTFSPWIMSLVFSKTNEVDSPYHLSRHYV